MNFLKEWGDFLLPEGGFATHDIWQLLASAVILIACSKVLSDRTPADASSQYTPKLWLRQNTSFIAWWGTLILFYLVCAEILDLEVPIFRLFAILGGTWLLIGLCTSCLKEKFWAQSIAILAYLVSSPFSVVLVNDSVEILEELTFSIGKTTVSAWGIIYGLCAFILTLWVSLAIARVLENQIKKVPQLSSSLKVLITKIIRIAFIVFASITAMSSMGVDLSALTVLGGAVGLGLGFGFQKVVSNFISGIILLIDNSIKPGDVIEIDGTYGSINNLRARYASVITRDGTEHLIPNEDLITQRVVNWSFTNNLIRIKAPIGVSYKADPHQCIALILEAAAGIDRILKDPAPSCPLREFGDNSVNLELRFWISDPANGVANIRSEVLLKIWDTFKEHGIEIPFPQRDLHLNGELGIQLKQNLSETNESR